MSPMRSPVVTAICLTTTLLWAAIAHAQTSDSNACAANKTEVGGRYMSAILECHPRLARGRDDAFDACVMRAARQLTRRFTAIEQAGGCTAVDNAPAVMARIDASITGIVALVDSSNHNKCIRRQLSAMAGDAERQTDCVAEAVALGAGHSVAPACQSRATDRFFKEFERAGDRGCAGDAAAIDAAIRAAAVQARNVIKPPVSTCAPIEVTALHGDNFLDNSRLAKIENGHVACMHIDDGTIASCAFSTVPGRQTGEWLESPQGHFALVGQAVALDGRPGGGYIVAARVSDAEPPACVEAAGMDTQGLISAGSELPAECMIEDPLAAYNARSSVYPYFSPLYNFATREVCSSNDPSSTINPHPDFAALVRSFPSSGAGPDDTFCYSGFGAALNDPNGVERDEDGYYLTDTSRCHYMNNGGFQVPAAKRPASFSSPVPRVNTKSFIVWRPVSPHIDFANGGSPAVEVFEGKTDFLSRTAAADATGPLPDLGDVGTSVTIGAITFSLAVGGNTLFVGTGGAYEELADWHPAMPGNDIAMGYENLQVQFATPVYSFGFDFVEPNLTMSPFDGVPVDSSFEIVMYRGSAEVGRVTFNAHDDVVGFVGVWSARAFDRVTIIDQTGDHDNEFFGQFYVGLTPKP